MRGVSSRVRLEKRGSFPLRGDLLEVYKVRTGLDKDDKEKLFPRTTGRHRLKVWGKGCRG